MGSHSMYLGYDQTNDPHSYELEQLVSSNDTGSDSYTYYILLQCTVHLLVFNKIISHDKSNDIYLES